MRKILAVAVVLGLAAVAMAGDRGQGLNVLVSKLNGSPTLLGSVVTDGGVAANNCTTSGATFDGGFGDLLEVFCNFDHTMKPGSCKVTAPSAGATNHLVIGGASPSVVFLAPDENALSFRPVDGGTWGRCDVSHLR